MSKQRGRDRREDGRPDLGLVRDQIYASLKESILSCEREPGSRFSESQIVIERGVSRSPVREALVRLAHEGLVVTYPQRGSFVSHIDMRKVQEAKFLRLHVERALSAELSPDEGQIAELSHLVDLQEIARKKQDAAVFFALDARFHRFLFEISSKTRLWEHLQHFCADLNRFRLLRLKAMPDWEGIVGQHRLLVDTLARADHDGAAACMTEHIGQFEKDRAEVLALYSGYFTNAD